MSVPVRQVLTRADRHRSPGPRHRGYLLAELLILVALAALSFATRRHPGPYPGDVGLERNIQQLLLPHQPLRVPLEGLSTLNWPVPTAVTLGVIVLLFVLLRRWLDAALTPVAAAVSSITTFGLSKWVHRPRPLGHGLHIMQHITSTYSFPSGHVTYAVTIFGLFLFLTTQVRRPIHPALIWTVRVVLIAIIVLMPVSRLLEGEHWPSDLLAGILDGLFWLVLFAHLYGWARRRWPRLLAADER